LPPVFDARRVAAAAGVIVELTDLGDWAGRLVSEYDPRTRTIRVNERALDAYRRAAGGLGSFDIRTFIDLAVAHELYHHCEAGGAIARLATRARREAAADAFARERVPVDGRLTAFFEHQAAS
jgi:hypothetical protein